MALNLNDYNIIQLDDYIKTDPRDFVYTSSGRINKKKLFDLCIKLLHKFTILEYTPTTLLEIYDHFDKKNSGDEMVDEFSSMTLYPIRIMVLKTLVLYHHKESLEFFAQVTEHKALSMMQEAQERELEHLPTPCLVSKETPCSCDRPTASVHAHTCVFCDSFVCPSCRKNPCAFTLQEVIEDLDSDDDSDDDMDDDSEEDSGYQEDEFDDDEEEMDYDN